MPNPPGSRNAKRQAAKEHRRAAAAAAARKRKRQQAMLGALAGVAVLGVALAVFFLVRGGGSDSTTGVAPSASATASAAPSAAAFPPVPAGADAALKTKPTVTAGTGAVTALKVTPLIEGTGAGAQTGQTVTVNYVGVTYKDGKEFDASWDKQQTFPVTLGQGGVIKGWDQGLVGAKLGSRLQLDIPASLAYGDPAPSGYPSGALRFVVDVLAIK